MKLLIIPFMMFVARWHGGAFFYAPKMLISLIWALPYAWSVYRIRTIAGFALFVLFLSAFAKSTGHGNFMDLGTWSILSDPETLEFLIAPLAGVLSPYWYDFTGLTLIGLVGTLPAAVVIFKADKLSALILLFSGACKSVAYAIGWSVGTQYPTEIGEVLSGLFAGVGLYVAFVRRAKS